MSSNPQRSFAGGEIAPALHARADLSRYAIGLKTCRNMVVMRAGGATKRPGTKFVNVAGSAGDHYILHTFSVAIGGPFQVTSAPAGATVRALLVAGGGAGGSEDGSGVGAGGGGGGGMIDNAAIAVAVGSYPVSVGSGGPKTFADHTLGGAGSATGDKGLDSTAFGLIAKGGGAGHAHDATSTVQCNGGSGGGVESTTEDLNGNGTVTGPFAGGTGTAGQGHDGGQSKADPTGTLNYYGGGGGGAGAAGSNYVTGNGGIGLQSDITGTPTYYAGGGGAGYLGSAAVGGLGGNGGGGDGGSGNPVTHTQGSDGVNGLGGGGGGGGATIGSQGGNGGEGTIMVRYKASSGIVAVGGVITTIPI